MSRIAADLAPYILDYRGPTDTKAKRFGRWKELNMKLTKVPVRFILRIIYEITYVYVNWYEKRYYNISFCDVEDESTL